MNNNTNNGGLDHGIDVSAGPLEEFKGKTAEEIMESVFKQEVEDFKSNAAERLETLDIICMVTGETDQWKHDDYTYGLANGLLTALHIMHGVPNSKMDLLKR